MSETLESGNGTMRDGDRIFSYLNNCNRSSRCLPGLTFSRMWVSIPFSSMMKVLRSVILNKVFPRMDFSPSTPYALQIVLSGSLIRGNGRAFFTMKF